MVRSFRRRPTTPCDQSGREDARRAGRPGSDARSRLARAVGSRLVAPPLESRAGERRDHWQPAGCGPSWHSHRASRRGIAHLRGLRSPQETRWSGPRFALALQVPRPASAKPRAGRRRRTPDSSSGPTSSDGLPGRATAGSRLIGSRCTAFDSVRRSRFHQNDRRRRRVVKAVTHHTSGAVTWRSPDRRETRASTGGGDGHDDSSGRRRHARTGRLPQRGRPARTWRLECRA